MATLTLEPVSSRICRVLDGQGCHVGNLKLIAGQWKFKAIGYDDSGACVPGGGPLTGRHNTVFERLDPMEISRGLG